MLPLSISAFRRGFLRARRTEPSTALLYCAWHILEGSHCGMWRVFSFHPSKKESLVGRARHGRLLGGAAAGRGGQSGVLIETPQVSGKAKRAKHTTSRKSICGVGAGVCSRGTSWFGGGAYVWRKKNALHCHPDPPPSRSGSLGNAVSSRQRQAACEIAIITETRSVAGH